MFNWRIVAIGLAVTARVLAKNHTAQPPQAAHQEQQPQLVGELYTPVVPPPLPAHLELPVKPVPLPATTMPVSPTTKPTPLPVPTTTTAPSAKPSPLPPPPPTALLPLAEPDPLPPPLLPLTTDCTDCHTGGLP